jgi:ABC-type Fe3+ transport system permease subunit
MRFLVQHPIFSGIVYGVAVHWVMNTIVLPLSRLPMGPRTPPFSFTLIMIVVHMLFVGLPIALTVTRSSRAQAFRRGESATPRQ